MHTTTGLNGAAGLFVLTLFGEPSFIQLTHSRLVEGEEEEQRDRGRGSEKMQKFHNHQTILLLLVLPSAAAPWMQEEDLLVFQQLAVRLNGWEMDDVALPCSSFLFFKYIY